MCSIASECKYMTALSHHCVVPRVEVSVLVLRELQTSVTIWMPTLSACKHYSNLMPFILKTKRVVLRILKRNKEQVTQIKL